MSTSPKVVAVLVAVVVLATVLAVALPEHEAAPSGGGEATPTAQPTPPATAEPTPEPPASPPPIPEGFTEFVDEEAGFAIAYPEDWRTFESPQPTVRLLVAASQDNAFSVRFLPLAEVLEDPAAREQLEGVAVESVEDLPLVRPYFDQLIQDSESTVRVLLGPEPLLMSGMPTLFYLYWFRDAESQEIGVHAHYFAFRGDEVYTLVLQALPRSAFEELQPVFSQIVSTFRLLEDGERAGAGATPAPTPTATGAPGPQQDQQETPAASPAASPG